MADIEVKNNGHSTESIPPEVKNILGMDIFKNAFTVQKMSTALEKLVDPGDKTEELLMRGHFWDVDYKNEWILALADAQHFENKEIENLLKNSAAADTSVEGRRIDLLVQSVIGQYNHSNNQSVWDRLKSSAGFKKDNHGN